MNKNFTWGKYRIKLLQKSYVLNSIKAQMCASMFLLELFLYHSNLSGLPKFLITQGALRIFSTHQGGKSHSWHSFISFNKNFASVSTGEVSDVFPYAESQGDTVYVLHWSPGKCAERSLAPVPRSSQTFTLAAKQKTSLIVGNSLLLQ